MGCVRLGNPPMYAASELVRSRGALTAMATIPLSTKSHTSSDSRHAVTTAHTAKSTHISASRPSTVRVSLIALRTMTAMTVAPTP